MSAVIGRDNRWMFALGVLAIIGVSGLAGALTTRLPASSALLDPITIVLIGMIAVVLTLGIQNLLGEFPQLGFRNPGILVFGYIFVSYVLRPLYILISGDFGTSFVQLTVAENIGLFRSTLIVTFLALLVFTVAYFAAPSNLLSGFLIKPRQLSRNSLIKLGFVGIISGASALFIFSEISALDGGWQAGLQGRGQFYEGRNYLIILISLYRSAFLVWLSIFLTGWDRLTVSRWMLVIALWLPSLLFDALSGGRGELVVYNVVPFFIILSFFLRGKAASRISLILAICMGLMIVVGYRALVRDQYTGADSRSVSSRLADIPEELLGGNETVIFDSLLIVIVSVPDVIPYRGLPPTLEMILTATVPSSLYPKPERTTTILTEALAPDVAAQGGNLTFSGAGDLYFSSGLLGLLIGFALIGFLAGMLIRSSSRAANSSGLILPLCFGWIAAAFIYSVVRTDLFGLSIGIIRLGTLVLSVLLLTGVSARTALGASNNDTGLIMKRSTLRGERSR